MSFSNQTEHYGLPQYAPDDKPTYLGDMNGAYATIDTKLFEANTKANTASEQATSALQTASSANSQAIENKSNIQSISSNVTNLSNSFNNLITGIKYYTKNYTIKTDNSNITIDYPELTINFLEINDVVIAYCNDTCIIKHPDQLDSESNSKSLIESIYIDNFISTYNIRLRPVGYLDALIKTPPTNGEQYQQNVLINLVPNNGKTYIQISGYNTLKLQRYSSGILGYLNFGFMFMFSKTN